MQHAAIQSFKALWSHAAEATAAAARVLTPGAISMFMLGFAIHDLLTKWLTPTFVFTPRVMRR